MANEFIIKNGFHSKGDSQVTGSLNVSSTLTVNGSAVGAAFPFSGDAQITGSLNVSSSITTFDINMSTWTLGADGGSNYYYFTGPGDLGGTEQNPDIHLTRGQKYRFYNPLNAHPFQIQDTGGSAFSTGVTNNGVQLGFLSFDVPMDGPTHLKYQCTSHAAMVGNIYIADARVASGSFSGSFQGDGSSLTGVSAFPFTGDAQITGSLIISGSFITSRNSDLSNTIIGSSSAAAMNSGATGNVIIGNETAKSLTSGDDNVIIGENAAQTITSGYDNVYIGHNSGQQAHSTNAIGNTVIGVDAGLGAGGANSYRNVFIGQQAGYEVDGVANVYVGWQAGRGEAGADGTANSGFGAYALTDNRDGNYNIGIGYYAGGAIKDGSNNIFIGSGSLGELNTESQLRIGHADLIIISASLTTGDILLQGDVSSSATSTASFGTYIGDGSQLSGISGGSAFPFTGDAQITGSLIISASATSQSLSVIGSGSTVFNVIGSEGTLFAIEDDLDGTLFTVNDRSGIPMFEVSASGRIVAEEGESIIRSQRPIVTHTSDFSITSSLDYAGKYHIVGGSITCSINTGSLVPTGAEFEFFQTSSAGNFLFITGSPHVDVIVKNDNMNLAGQGSGASLKYIGGSTFHLVGDLT